MKVLVTGGAGYIGSELIKLLATNPEITDIIVYDNMSRHNYSMFLGHRLPNHQKVKFVEGDILDSRTLRKNLKGVEVVYHLAANVTTPFSNLDPHFFEQVNHWGSAEIVYAIEDSDVKKVVYTSSTSVYGSSREYLDENSVPNPRSFYAISKMRGEEHMERLNDQVDTYILRCGNVYGYSRSMRFDAVINRFMFEANFRRRISIHGTGSQSRSFIHIDRVTKILEDIVFNEVPSGMYNIVGKNMSILDVVDVVKELYPDLEFLFVNQHLSLRNIFVRPETKLSQFMPIPEETDLKSDLTEFKEKFCF